MLGAGAKVTGRISGEGDLRVLGSVEGDVTISGELVIEDGGEVSGDVGAASLVVSGTLRGDVDARGPVALRAGAQVEGDLRGSEISLDEGAHFRGNVSAEFDLPAELVDASPKADARAARARR